MFMRSVTAKLRWLCLAILVVPTLAATAESSASEYAVKAAMIYKITKFVSWPEAAFVRADSPLNICMAEDSPFKEAMHSLQGRKVKRHKVEIITFKDFSAVQAQCQVLVVSHKKARQVGAMINGIGDRPILTIGDSEGFAEQGGIIGLEQEQSRVSFAINVDASERVGLQISAQLLQLATIVSTVEGRS
jgi:hypothetical protein